ncbi:RND transporter [Terrihabitans soli]|uniref:RND transporter n=1 Tax=Terrihabitans soli TaxID=708113 RepID=A0A6S6QNI4_9HYPH|nr:efflux RND transporter periplasmic adaptor subunit [Terrihabitans soli]BCJ90976.1 RND transporter [Terrihabitans soli]
MMLRALIAVCGTLILSGCDSAEAPPAAEARPVRVMTVKSGENGRIIALTGTVQAQTEVSLSFRIDGRMVERLVNIGDAVKAGQAIARLDPQNEENAVRSARAQVAAAAGKAAEARGDYDRQQQLLSGGWIAQARYDQAAQVRQTTQSQLDAAHAQLSIAEDHLGFATLYADAEGVVVARGAEPGEVVRAGQMIVQIARTDGRDAVFDVPPQIKDQAPANPVIDVSLTMDPSVKTTGRVREVSPRADRATGTFEVRVGLSEPPAQMRLGATVSGRMQTERDAGIAIPATALTSLNGQPAVWVVDPQGSTTALRPIEIAEFDQARILIASGLEAGEIVVTAGVQALRPGQKVRLLEAGS